MAIYDSEEEQLEAVKAWWRENGTSTLVGVVVGVAFIVGTNVWKTYNQEKVASASDAYSQMVTAIGANEKTKIEPLIKRLHEEFADTSYATYAGLQEARLKVQQGDLAGAKAVLQDAVGKSSSELSHIARLRLVRLMLATGEYEKGLQMINEVDPAVKGGYSGSYDELSGDLYVALDRLDEARTAYQSALNSGAQSPLLKMKIDDLTAGEPVPVAQPNKDSK